MVQVELSRIIIDEQKKEQIVVLKEKAGTKLLPIIIGINEAAAIRMKLSGFVPPRPLTHDLIKNIIDTLGVQLEKVVIDKLVDSTFHAKLYVRRNGQSEMIDARPSDSIALAVRTKSPLFVEDSIFDQLSGQG